MLFSHEPPHRQGIAAEAAPTQARAPSFRASLRPFVALAPEDEDDDWVVEMQPGNYTAFFESWDSGGYDT